MAESVNIHVIRGDRQNDAIEYDLAASGEDLERAIHERFGAPAEVSSGSHANLTPSLAARAAIEAADVVVFHYGSHTARTRELRAFAQSIGRPTLTMVFTWSAEHSGARSEPDVGHQIFSYTTLDQAVDETAAFIGRVLPLRLESSPRTSR